MGSPLQKMLQQDYKINLELFEGPLDLLLHLIKKNDVSIYDIPIALILDEYLGYINMMKELNIDLAGEFILTASELAHIKSRLLLHHDDAEEEELDPRADLIARLLEYQKYKTAASILSRRPLLFRDVFVRFEKTFSDEEDKKESLIEIEPFQLLSVFNEVLRNAPKETVHEIEGERISITECIYQIVEHLKNMESMLFEDLFNKDFTRSDIVITFLAILEMARLRMVQIYQTDRFGPIRIRRTMDLSEEIKSSEISQ